MPGKLLLYKGRAAGQDNTVQIPSLVPGVAFFPSPSVGVVLSRDGASSLEALRVTLQPHQSTTLLESSGQGRDLNLLWSQTPSIIMIAQVPLSSDLFSQQKSAP